MVLWILYTGLILGILLLFSNSIQLVLRKAMELLSASGPQVGSFKTVKTRLRALLAAVLGDSGSEYIETYGLGYLLFCLASLIFFLRNMPIGQAVQSQLLVVVTPLVFLRVQLYTIRIESSYEGEFLISELLNQYRINHFNMIEAMDQTVIHLKNTPRTRSLLFSMSLRLKAYRNEGHLDEILSAFNYLVDTQWSRMLTNNIRLSVHEGLNVSSGLLDIQNELRRAKESYEKGERSATEGFAMVKFLIPILYALTVFLAVRLFGFTVSKFIRYQFFTTSGLKLIVICSALYLLNLVIMVLFKRRKFDIT